MPAARKDIDMLNSNYKDACELPIFLNVPTVAKLLGISVSSCYELARNKSFPKLRIGSRIVIPRERFWTWVEENVSGAKASKCV